MLSQEDADACIERVAIELQNLSYEELVRLSHGNGDRDGVRVQELQVGRETVYVNTTIGALGRFRKRICVEMVLSAEDGTLWPDTPCVYFERFESGRLHVMRGSGLERAMFMALPYVFLVAAVLAVAVLVWNWISRVA